MKTATVRSRAIRCPNCKHVICEVYTRPADTPADDVLLFATLLFRPAETVEGKPCPGCHVPIGPVERVTLTYAVECATG